MKTIDWLRCLTRLRAEEGKQVFCVAELANIADTSAAVVNVGLRRLVNKGIVTRYVPGKYGLPGGAAVEDLVRAIDSDAYVTAAAALARHGLITQVPQLVECFTRRRHNRSRERHSPLGTLVFTCVAPAVHAQPEGGLAGPGQALCDLVYMSRRRGLDPRSLFTFRKLHAVNLPEHLLARYPRTVRNDVCRLVGTASSMNADRL